MILFVLGEGKHFVPVGGSDRAFFPLQEWIESYSGKEERKVDFGNPKDLRSRNYN